ncbi:hypothetical protein [Mycobacterium sp.]|uniref:hypothetical protein n=1 Tax=Mycobacterium sp. TaxID=1785 RepID=UPI003BA99D69
MHKHPLHRAVMVKCDCCRLLNEFVFRSVHDQVICKSCRRHIGADDEARRLRDSDHAQLYLSEIGVLQEDLSEARHRPREDFQKQLNLLRSELRTAKAEVSDQVELIATLRAAVKEHQVENGLAEWLAGEEVAEAHNQRDRARRATGLILQALSRLTVYHGRHETRPYYCVCGKHVDQCGEYRAIESEFDVLAKWEAEQFTRHRDGLEHGLCAAKVRRMERSA